MKVNNRYRKEVKEAIFRRKSGVVTGRQRRKCFYVYLLWDFKKKQLLFYKAMIIRHLKHRRITTPEDMCT